MNSLVTDCVIAQHTCTSAIHTNSHRETSKLMHTYLFTSFNQTGVAFIRAYSPSEPQKYLNLIFFGSWLGWVAISGAVNVLSMSRVQRQKRTCVIPEGSKQWQVGKKGSTQAWNFTALITGMSNLSSK